MPVTTDTAVAACPSCGTKNRVPSSATGRPRCASCQADLPWLVAADGTNYTEVVEQSPLPVLVDAWAPWCAPCNAVGPLVQHLAGEYAGRLKVVKVDVDQAPEVAQRLGVQGIPAIFFVRDGKIVDSLVGARPLPDLQAAVEAILAES